LILAPFIARSKLQTIFSGVEPLDRLDLLDRFRTLLGVGAGAKPFECVGDLQESLAALRLAAGDPERADQSTLQILSREVSGSDIPVDELLHPIGPDFIPSAYAASTDLV
jgi:hypothetical protein